MPNLFPSDIPAFGVARLHGIEQHGAVCGENVFEHGRDAAHGGVVGDPFAAAHHEPQTVVVAQVVFERRQVVPQFERHEIEVRRAFAAFRTQVLHRRRRGEDHDLDARILGQITDAAQPHLESRLLLGLLGHHDQVAFDGRQGLCGVVDEGRDVAPRDEGDRRDGKNHRSEENRQ